MYSSLDLLPGTGTPSPPEKIFTIPLNRVCAISTVRARTAKMEGAGIVRIKIV